jgi:peptidoglycan/xylan/chitin deacetylase (PgdA/CDA1 family)
MSVKRAAKKGIAFAVDLVKLGARNSIPGKPGFRVLLYHSIQASSGFDPLGLRVDPADFARQMELLSTSGYQVSRLEDLVDSLIKNDDVAKNRVAIVFDDGYKDNLTVACAVLHTFNFPATVFLRAELVSGRHAGGDYWDTWEYLTNSDIRQLSGTGAIDIGSHGISHRKLTALSETDLEKEVRDSKSMLEDNIRRPVSLFSYPYGCFNARVKDSAAKAGYKAAFSSFAGINTGSSDRFELRRIQVDAHDRRADVSMKLRGSYDWLYSYQRLSGYR